MITGTISSKGQVTIPKKIRQVLRVQAYDKIVFIPLEDGKVMITTRQNPATALFGMLKHRKTKKSVSVKDMDSAIRKRRAKRHRS
jgi:AbrB family looped-hinge helix DNA binding protein